MSLQVVKRAVREKGIACIRPVHFDVGVALAISVGGIIYAYLKIKRRRKANKSKPSQQRSPGGNSQNDSRRENVGLAFLDSTIRRVYSHNAISDHRSSLGDPVGLLLPEFNELVKECDAALATAHISPHKSAQHSKYNGEHDDHNMHVRRQERESSSLEVQLLEHYGIKAHETTVMELHNRLRLHNMEAKIYNFKIESLESHNRRLEAQLAAHARLVTELEAEKVKTKMLGQKLKSELEQNNEHILAPQDRVTKPQEQEGKGVGSDQDQAKKEMEAQLEEMKQSNQELKQENSDLLQKLEYVKMLTSSALESEELNERKEENRCLRERNEELKKEIERVEANWWADIEELVYLRWTNTCLRYELKNYKPSAGRASHGDICKVLSPRSEEKVKQMILENTYKEGSFKKRMDTTDFDSGHGSSLHSCVAGSGERNNLSVPTLPVDKSSHSSRKKVFSKLKRLLTGKGISQPGKKKLKPLERAVSADNIEASYSSYTSERFTASSKSTSSSRHSLDLQRSLPRSQKSASSNNSLRNSDASSSIITRINSLTEEDEKGWSQGCDQQHAKDELLKYAETLKNARAKRSGRSSATCQSR